MWPSPAALFWFCFGAKRVQNARDLPRLWSSHNVALRVSCKLESVHTVVGAAALCCNLPPVFDDLPRIVQAQEPFLA